MTARWTGPWGDHRRYRVDLPADDPDGALAGGEGLVFMAVVDRTGEAVALKMLTALPVDDYGRVAQRGVVFAEVGHPNLMHQVDIFIGPPLTTDEEPDARDFGIIYTVADWVSGRDLDDAVEDVDARIPLGWVAQVARAVEHLHRLRTDLAPQGIVHRDIKPSNVRITPEGRAVLIDFGVARPFEATGLTTGVGTHLWRAPEVMGGVGEPGPASDGWGVGALAYWVLLREPPPLDSAATARERLLPAARAAGFPDPAGLAHHIARLLELQPARRPERLDRWADELEAVARRSAARRLARPVAAGTMALVAVGVAAWTLAPPVARLGRRDSAAQRTASQLVAQSQLFSPTRPAVALALAAEARHRHDDAETQKAVDHAYDAFARTGIIATLRGHTDSVSGVAISDDGSRVVSSSDDHTVRLWDPTGRRVVDAIDVGTVATAVAMSRTGLVAAGGEDGSVRLWNPSVPGSEHQVADATTAITGVALSPDGSLLAFVAQDGSLEVRASATGALVRHPSGSYRGVAFGGDKVLVAGRGGKVDVFDLGRESANGEFDTGYDRVLAVGASEDGSVVAAGLAGGHAVIHDLAAGSDVPIDAAHTGDVVSVDVRPDGKVVVTASPDGSAKVWDARSGALLSSRVGHEGGITAVAIGAAGAPMVTAGDDMTVRLWRPVGGRELLTMPSMGDVVQGVAYSPDGRLVAAVSSSGKATVWSADTGDPVVTVDADPTKAFAVAFSPDGTVLATGGADGIIRLWDPTMGASRGELEGHEQAVWSLAFAADRDVLASASGDGTIRRWDWRSGQPVGQPLRVGKARVEAVDITHDGAMVAGADDHGVVREFDTATGEVVHEPDPHEESTIALALSPDDRWLATGGDGDAIQVWDARTGKRLEKLEGHRDTISTLAFSADGSRLASASDDRAVELWDTRHWTKVSDFVADRRRVLSVGFSPDGTRLVTGGGDGTVKVWPTTTVEERELCAEVAAQVSATELRQALDGIEPQACTNVAG